MFLAGDEFCNTQFGNNNAYCQDNLISWLNWDMRRKHADMYAYFRFLIHYRHARIRSCEKIRRRVQRISLLSACMGHCRGTVTMMRRPASSA